MTDYSDQLATFHRLAEEARAAFAALGNLEGIEEGALEELAGLASGMQSLGAEIQHLCASRYVAGKAIGSEG